MKWPGFSDSIASPGAGAAATSASNVSAERLPLADRRSTGDQPRGLHLAIADMIDETRDAIGEKHLKIGIEIRRRLRRPRR